MAVALQCDHLLESMAIWMQVCVKRQGFQSYEMVQLCICCIHIIKWKK